MYFILLRDDGLNYGFRLFLDFSFRLEKTLDINSADLCKLSQIGGLLAIPYSNVLNKGSHHSALYGKVEERILDQ